MQLAVIEPDRAPRYGAGAVHRPHGFDPGAQRLLIDEHDQLGALGASGPPSSGGELDERIRAQPFVHRSTRGCPAPHVGVGPVERRFERSIQGPEHPGAAFGIERGVHMMHALAVHPATQVGPLPLPGQHLFRTVPRAEALSFPPDRPLQLLGGGGPRLTSQPRTVPQHFGPHLGLGARPLIRPGTVLALEQAAIDRAAGSTDRLGPTGGQPIDAVEPTSHPARA